MDANDTIRTREGEVRLGDYLATQSVIPVVPKRVLAALKIKENSYERVHEVEQAYYHDPKISLPACGLICDIQMNYWARFEHIQRFKKSGGR